jgi:parvulin-like peptidyl-prolyl isomerase
MRPLIILIAVGLLSCGCQGTGPAKIDNPVVGPPPPRLPPDQIQQKKLAAAQKRVSREIKVAQNSDGQDDVLGETDQSIRQTSAKGATADVSRRPDEEVVISGIQQIRQPRTPTDPVPKLEDGTIVATVNGQPIFAGEVLAPGAAAFATKDAELRKALGKDYKPEMLDRGRLIFIEQSLPRMIERKMLVHAAKTGLKKSQAEQLKKAIAGQWNEELELLMKQNDVGTVNELEVRFKQNNFNLDDHKNAFEDQKAAQMYVSSKVHTKYQPSRLEMIAFYEEHKEEFKSIGKVRWDQLVVSYEAHGGKEGARKQIDKVVKELLAGADFRATVKKYGDGPRVVKGGAWEWTERGALQSKEVEDQIFSLPIGDMSGVIETKGSYQIVQVLERTEDAYTPFEQLQEKIKEQMISQVYSDKAAELLKTVRKSAIIVTCFDEDWAERKKGAPVDE